MRIIDRYIMKRMVVNFILLFLLLYLFATTIDIILNLEQFDDVARARLGEDAGFLRRMFVSLGLALNFHGPQFFQFYAYLHGLVAIGALGFTISQMSRHRELVAMIASGVSLHRASYPVLWVVAGLGVLQLVNQEFIMPRMAPLLLRTHEQIGMASTSSFPIAFTLDSSGALLQSPGFDPVTGVLMAPSIIIRDERGRTVQRLRASEGVWDQDQGCWLLADGVRVDVVHSGEQGTAAMRPQPVDRFATDLSPNLLTIRRFAQFTGMLSSWQIGDMLESPDVREADTLLRSRYARWATVLVNVLIIMIALPFFMHREPVKLIMRTFACILLVVPLYLIVGTFMLIPLPGISPALGAFLPVIVLLPIAMARFGWIRT
ncbi:MAG: LptF/LptG family permease [Phycisphaerales bacterium]|nr:LptF/LptG family permease [Phycisphaerales bacterium]